MLKTPLLLPPHISPEVRARGESINEDTRKTFSRWLIASSLAKTEDLRDGLYEEDMLSQGVALDATQRKPNQRLLLDVEKAGELRRASVRIQQKKTQEYAKQILANNMYKHMCTKLQDTKHVYQNLLKIPAHFPDLMDAIYSPAANYRTLHQITSAIPGLNKQILRLINNPDFCRSMGRQVRDIKEPQMAFGALGEVGIKQILPMMVIKHTLRPECAFIPMFNQKLWSYATTKGNTIAYLLGLHHGKHNSDVLDGLFLGLFSTLGTAAIHHQFARSFDEVKLVCLEKLRDTKKRDLYNAMIDVSPDPRVMARCVIDEADGITARLSQEFNWGRLANLGTALQAHTASPYEIPEKRDIYSLALSQAEVFSIYEMLRRAKIAPDKEEASLLFQQVGLVNRHANQLIRHDMRKVDLRLYG